jgi:hypothetical protein
VAIGQSIARKEKIAIAEGAWPRAAGISRGTARQRAEELLTRVGLRDRMTHRPGDLSGGPQQRVAVARAIALDPLLILADEPTAHLDFIQVEEVLRLICEPSCVATPFTTSSSLRAATAATSPHSSTTASATPAPPTPSCTPSSTRRPRDGRRTPHPQPRKRTR